MSELSERAILPLASDRDPLEALDRLIEAGIDAELVLRVPAEQAGPAMEILTVREGSPSHALDLETIARVPELEAASIRGLLESNGIQVVVEEAIGLPSLPIEINVARKDAAAAKQLIAEAKQVGEESLRAEPSDLPN